MECFYSNVSYQTGVAKLFTATFYYERAVYWRVTVRGSGRLIDEVHVAVEAEDLVLDKQVYTELRNAQIEGYEAERMISSQEMTHGEN